jgi:hypothetical protein
VFSAVDTQLAVVHRRVDQCAVVGLVRVGVGVPAEEAAGHAHPCDGDRARALQAGDEILQQLQCGVLVGDGFGRKPKNEFRACCSESPISTAATVVMRKFLNEWGRTARDGRPQGRPSQVVD